MNLIDVIKEHVGELPKDQPIAIVGKTYSGKSTFMLELMLALNEVSMVISQETYLGYLTDSIMRKRPDSGKESPCIIGVDNSGKDFEASVRGILDALKFADLTVGQYPDIAFIDSLGSVPVSTEDLLSGKKYQQIIDVLEQAEIGVVYTYNGGLPVAKQYTGKCRFPKWMLKHFIIEVDMIKEGEYAGHYTLTFISVDNEPTLLFNPAPPIMFSEYVGKLKP